MKIEKTFSINAPQQTVWEFVKNPRKMAPCIPGCKNIITLDPTHYEAEFQVKIGPISANFELVIEILEETPPSEIISKIRGQEGSRASTVTADNFLRLTGSTEKMTEIYCVSESSVVGRLGRYGLGVMKKKADATWDEFANNLRRKLEGEDVVTSVPSAKSGVPILWWVVGVAALTIIGLFLLI